jgi:plasmid maintenance system antidote protein VapI
MQTEKRAISKINTAKARRDFRHFLQDELALRCQRNSSYSLRSFAKLLDISPSALSALLNAKRPITHKMKERLGLNLGLSLSEIKNLKSNPHGNTKLGTDSIDGESFHQVTIDMFTIISEPYHYALLELTKTEGFSWESRWLAQRLKITVSEINIAIERLERVGLLERDNDGKLFDSTKGFSTDIREGLSSQAQRQFQKRSLEQAISAVQTIPFSERDNTSMTMAINAKDLPKAKQMIKEFRRRFCGQMEASSSLNEVYQLTISFIPLTTPNGGST